VLLLAALLFPVQLRTQSHAGPVLFINIKAHTVPLPFLPSLPTTTQLDMLLPNL
jgi:hypothetical protein